jgi:alkylation response protein AidB-like acyl-CoA dehydrogenase
MSAAAQGGRTEATPLHACTDEQILQRVQDLLPLIREHSGRIDEGRELTPEVLQAMHGAQLFRLSLPRALGGAELRPPLLAQVTEAIAGADASAAWCLGQGLGCAMSAAFMSPVAARQVFGPANAVLAWGAGIQGKAVACDGGYRVSGKWGFASGGKHATWLGAHCRVFEADGSPRLDAGGRHVDRTALLPREVADIADDWYVMGLRGTRSEGYAVEDLFVEEALTLDREAQDELQVTSTLYRFPTTNVYAGAFSGVALGIARAMLDTLVELARSKTARGASSSMRDSPVVQTRLAELEAKLRAARAYQQQTLSEVWEAVCASDELCTADRMRIRLATTYAINEATEVGEQVYRLAGATAIFDSQPFEQRFRDAHAVSQQVQGRFTHYETVGRHLLGLDAGSMFV